MRAFLPLLAVLAAASSTTRAAEVTDLPPKFRGDIHLDYGGAFDSVGLEEGGDVYGLRTTTTHRVDLDVEVAVWKGVAVRLGFPIVAAQTIAYPAARQMLFEPVTGDGSYTNGPALDPAPTIDSSGLQGVWIGVVGAPFREDYDRGLPVTTRFDFAVRTPMNGQTLYDASRGAAPGGVAVHLAGAFSVRRGIANPWMRFAWTHELPGSATLVSPDGTEQGEITVRGPTTVAFGVGAELVAYDNPTRHHRVAIDPNLEVRYEGPAEVGSGFWLPSVLDATRDRSVIRGERLRVQAGLALDVHLTRYFGFRLGGAFRYATPHKVENTYEVRTDAQSFGTMWTVDLVGRIRLKGDRE